MSKYSRLQWSGEFAFVGPDANHSIEFLYFLNFSIFDLTIFDLTNGDLHVVACEPDDVIRSDSNFVVSGAG